MSCVSLFFPNSVLELTTGERGPKVIPRPTETLDQWVLGLESLPVPNQTVREFFLRHDQVLHDEEKIWTPDDPSLGTYAQVSNYTGLHSPADENEAWEAFESWLLSGQPAAPAGDREVITAWIRGLDQIPEPSVKLRNWVASMRQPQSPSKELRLMILGGKQEQWRSWMVARDQVRLSAPCAMATCLFTLLGVLSPSIRRPLARTFVLMGLFWIVARLRSSLGPTEWTLQPMMLYLGLFLGIAIIISAVKPVPRMTAGWLLFFIISAWWISIVLVASIGKYETASLMVRTNITVSTFLMAVAGIMNSWYWLIGKSEDPPQDDAGIAQRRPPLLWTIWLVQFLILMANGLLAFVFPEWTAEVFTHERFDYLTSDIVNDSTQMLGAWVIGMALLSYFALGAGTDWVWQGISVIFGGVFAVLAASTVVAATSGAYSFWVYVYGFQGVIFIPLTAVLLLKRDPFSMDNVEKAKCGEWTLTDLLVGSALMWQPLLRGRRKFYQRGVGASGYMELLETDKERSTYLGIMPDEISEPGQRFPIQMRFSNCSQKDDASLDIRGCALQIMCGSVSRFDLLFATGAFAPFSTLLDFRRLARCRNLKHLIRKDQIIREGLAAGMRRAPSSFADLSYYHQFVLEWLSATSENLIIRFRIIPHPPDGQLRKTAGLACQGLPDDEDLLQLWQQARRSEEMRPDDYLGQQLHEQFSKGQPVRFQLEVQVHDPEPSDSLNWYDASVEWNERQCPWKPMALLTLDKPLSEAESDALTFNPGNLPHSLNVPLPDSLIAINDPRFPAAMRHRTTVTFARVRNRHRTRQTPTEAPGTLR